MTDLCAGSSPSPAHHNYLRQHLRFCLHLRLCLRFHRLHFRHLRFHRPHFRHLRFRCLRFCLCLHFRLSLC